MISRLISLTCLTLHQDIWMIFYIINAIYFDKMVSQIYPAELQLNKTNTYDTGASFLDFLLIIRRLVITLMYCDIMHAWQSTQSWLTSLLFSLFARWRVGPKII